MKPIHKPEATSIEPGLELDKLIAEKVLGWYQDSDVGGPRAWWRDKDDTENIFHLNYFSTDIKAAWELVEKFELCIVPWDAGWSAFAPYRFGRDCERNKAPTAPHAICLAALFYTNEGGE